MLRSAIARHALAPATGFDADFLDELLGEGVRGLVSEAPRARYYGLRLARDVN